ncbi:MAG: T9SS type A sorting domain-containing protein [Saprospiraceae bacterium]
MRKYSLPFFLFIAFNSLSAQDYDRYWVSGYSLSAEPPYQSNIVDFKNPAPTVDTTTIGIEIVGCAGAISDADGNLQFYTNGGQIHNHAHAMMENGDGINPYPLLTNPLRGSPIRHTLSILPSYTQSDIYYVIHQFVEVDTTLGLCINETLLTTVDMSANNGLGKVISKNVPIIQFPCSEYASPVRHANGRDWWIVIPEYKYPIYHTLLFSEGVVVESFTQNIGYKPDWEEDYDGGGINLFSPDGGTYVDHDPWNGTRIFDFDRCTGTLSNFRHITYPSQLPIGSAAVISPNSRYMYITASSYMMQFDLEAPDLEASKDTVAVWDGFYSPQPPLATTFGTGQLALNGKIYVAPNNGVKHLHSIEYPDLPGDSCMVLQHSLEMPNYYALATPMNPNFRLYDEPGSVCDSLGIDGPPIVHVRPVPGDFELHVYPNPATEYLVIESAFLPTQPDRLRLYSLDGKKVMERSHPSGVRSYSFDLPEMPSGVYILEVSCRGGQRYLKKVVVGR